MVKILTITYGFIIIKLSIISITDLHFLRIIK